MYRQTLPTLTGIVAKNAHSLVKFKMSSSTYVKRVYCAVNVFDAFDISQRNVFRFYKFPVTRK